MVSKRAKESGLLKLLIMVFPHFNEFLWWIILRIRQILDHFTLSFFIKVKITLFSIEARLLKKLNIEELILWMYGRQACTGIFIDFVIELS